MADTIADLRDWHGATTPQFVAALLKQAWPVIQSAFGAALLPQLFGGDSNTTTKEAEHAAE